MLREQLIVRRKAVHLAVAAALPLLMVGNAYAACSGTIVSPSTANSISVLCNGADTVANGVTTHVGNYTNAANLADATTQTVNGSNTLIQFDGQGRTLDNAGSIVNNRIINATTGTGRGRTAVLMGNSTLNPTAGTLFTTSGATATLPAVGATSVTLNAAAPAAYLGQTLVFGRYNADQGDFPAGVTRVITAIDATNSKIVTFADALPADYAGVGTDPVGYKIVSNFGGGNNVVNNSGTISAQILATEINANKNAAAVTATSIANGVANIVTAIGGSSAAYTAAAKAVSMTVEGDYIINNTAGALIGVKNEGLGAAYAIEEGGTATSLKLTNDGTISAERAARVTLVDNLAGNSAAVAAPNATATTFSATTATSADFAGFSKQNLASVNAINTQEEGALFDLTNNATGVIRATGDYSGAIYMRAAEQIINNAGTIEWVAATGHTGARGYAIGSVSDSGQIRTLNVENDGTITGDILGVNGMAERWHNLSVEGALDNRLNINSQFGQLDSTITNTGTITGDIYLSNGTHVFSNHAGATLIGNFDVDQRDTTCGQASAVQAGCATPGIGENAIQTKIVEVKTTSGSKSQTVNVYNLSPAAGEVTAAADIAAAVAGLTPASTATNATASAANATASASTFTREIVTIGTKNFTFENAGTFNGNITVHTASSALLGHTVTSEVTLIPTITGSGAGSTLAAPDTTGIAGLGTTLNVITTAGGSAESVTIRPKVASGVTVVDGAVFKLTNAYQVDSVAQNASTTSLPMVEGTNRLLGWTAEVNASGNLVLAAELHNATAVTGISKEAGHALNALLGTGSALGSQVLNLADTEIVKAAEQLRPEVNNAGMNAAMGMTTQVQDVVGGHIGEVHLTKAGMSGIATGEGTLDNGFWVQGFGFHGNQDRLKGVDGYSASAGGFALGADTLINPDVRVGLAVSYGRTGVDANGVNTGNKTDLDSYQALAYASYLGAGWYVNGNVGVALHKFDTSRVALGQTMKGNHDAWQFSGKVDGGYPILVSEKISVIPMLSLAYSHLAQDGYTETGAAALRVGDVDTDSFRTGAGAKALLTVMESSDVKAVLEGRAMWHHEFGDNSQDTSAAFTAGGATFTTNGVSVDRNSYNVGASLQLSGKSAQQTLTLSYDADLRDQYVGHTAKVQARFDF